MRTVADSTRLDRMFFALADVHRRDMLDRLSRGPASVSELDAMEAWVARRKTLLDEGNLTVLTATGAATAPPVGGYWLNASRLRAAAPTGASTCQGMSAQRVDDSRQTRSMNGTS